MNNIYELLVLAEYFTGASWRTDANWKLFL